MNEEERANWQRIKDSMEENGSTDNYFYKRAVTICAGGKDPMESLPTEPLEQQQYCCFSMADRAGAKSKAKTYTKSKKKGAMDGMTVKGHKLLHLKAQGLQPKVVHQLTTHWLEP